jgi:hypothetical protein
MKRISSFEEFVPFIELAVKTHKDLRGKWEPDMNENEFRRELIQNFNSNNLIFAETDGIGDLKYFIYIVFRDEPWYWLLYVHPRYRYMSKNLVYESLDEVKKSGNHKRVLFESFRLTPSYRRWVRKFKGTKPIAEIYEFNLQN